MDDGAQRSSGFPGRAWTVVLLSLASVILVGIVAAVVVCELTSTAPIR